MKKYSKLSIITGIVLLVLGITLPFVRLNFLQGFTYILVLMSESVWLTSALFGLSLLIVGIVTHIFKYNKAENVNAKTEIFSICSGITLGIAIYYSLMWLIIVQSALQNTNHKDYIMSIAITLVCLVAFFLTSGFYFKERKEKEFKKGLGFGVLNTIVFVLPAFFLADNIYKILINII